MNKVAIILSMLFLLTGFTASATTIEVGAGQQYPTIKRAVEAAKDGDVIVIRKGRYSEGEILINKRITIKGIHFPIIDGDNKFQVLRIQGEGIIIEGLEIRNAAYSSAHDWSAIKVLNSRNIIIRNNRLLNNSSGVYLQNTTHTEISNNIIHGNSVDEVESGNAVHCWKSSHLRILDNELTGHRDGLYFEFVTASLIRGNNSFSNLRYGIHFMFSHNDIYINNTFRANGAGVAVMFSKHVIMQGNRFEENWGSGAYGIMLKEIADGVVAHNTFNSNTVAIFMEGTSRMVITKNIFRSNGWAMRVQASCMDNIIARNNFFSNTFDVSTNGELQLNKFINNYWEKYEGYDLNRDGYGDVRYMPVSLYSMIVEKVPAASLLLRSFMVGIMDKAERIIPSITPLELKDDKPLMKPLAL